MCYIINNFFAQIYKCFFSKTEVFILYVIYSSFDWNSVSILELFLFEGRCQKTWIFDWLQTWANLTFFIIVESIYNWSFGKSYLMKNWKDNSEQSNNKTVGFHTYVWFMSFGQSAESQNWCWMSNICYCFLTAAEFYNLGHIQGIVRVQ